MLENTPGVFDPSFEMLKTGELHTRRMEVNDVNTLVELAHQPYMYRKQSDRFKKRFPDLTGGFQEQDTETAHQEAISVLRFVLQMLWAFGLQEEEIISFAEKVGNVPTKDLYRGESALTFFEDSSSSPSEKNELRLDFRFRISGSYKSSISCNLNRQQWSNKYFPFGCLVDGYIVDDNNNDIADKYDYIGLSFLLVRVYVVETSFNKEMSQIRKKCRALAALVDYLGTLHLADVELRIHSGLLFHQTNTLITQAWRVAFEALTETATRNDKRGKKKPKYRVICCIDCKSPRIVKYGKNAVRCPLCSNNNTKGDKSRQRRVY